MLVDCNCMRWRQGQGGSTMAYMGTLTAAIIMVSWCVFIWLLLSYFCYLAIAHQLSTDKKIQPLLHPLLSPSIMVWRGGHFKQQSSSEACWGPRVLILIWCSISFVRHHTSNALGWLILAILWFQLTVMPLFLTRGVICQTDREGAALNNYALCWIGDGLLLLLACG